MPPPIKLPFSGDKLRATRERAGLTQQDVAGRIGVALACISRYENHHNVPSVSVFGRLVTALDCQPADLLNDEAAA